MMQEILHDGERLWVLRDAHLALDDCHLVTLDSNGDGDDHAPTLRAEPIGLAGSPIGSD